MAGSSFGTIFKITTWGESHGKGLGVVVDGCPAGLPLDENDIQKFLNRRKPGQSKFTTPRKEDDAVEILSGVFEGKTTGTPISLVVYNQNQKSKDYSEIASYYRPGPVPSGRSVFHHRILMPHRSMKIRSTCRMPTLRKTQKII